MRIATPSAAGIAWATFALASLLCPPAAACSDVRPASKPQAAKPESAFDWPAPGRVFVECWSDNGKAINIAARAGTPVRAAQSGRVIFAGPFLAHLNVVLIMHARRIVSATSGDFSEMRVKKGDTVEKGRLVAVMGGLGDFAAPRLTFELRQGAEAIDPRPLMNDQERLRAAVPWVE